jgi:hypothetical protein
MSSPFDDGAGVVVSFSLQELTAATTKAREREHAYEQLLFRVRIVKTPFLAITEDRLINSAQL